MSPRNRTTKTPDAVILDEGELQGSEFADTPEREEPKQVIHEPDTWHIVGESLVRKHNTPRKTLYVPTPEEMPIPLKYIDVFRFTNTDLPSKSEATVHDFWTSGPIELSDDWIGTTKFHLLRPKPDPG